MPEFRWSIDGGVTWTYEDQPLPHILPVTGSQVPIVQALGTPVASTDFDMPAAYSALEAQTVVLVGASLIDRADDTPARAAYMDAAFTNMGYSGVLDNRAVGGDRFVETQSRLDQILVDYTGAAQDTFVLMHRSGNDISDIRPLDGTDATSFRADLDALTTKLKGAGFTHLGASNISKRYYTTAPSVTVADPASDANGSLPFNQHCVEPWIAAEMPDHAGQIDAYSWIENAHWLVTQEDGVHLWEEWQHIFAEWLLWQNARIYADLRADVTGRSVIFHTSRFTHQDAVTLDGTTNPVPKLRTRNVDSTGQPLPGLVVEFEGGSPPQDSGGGGAAAGVADSRLAAFTTARMHCTAGGGTAAHDHITWRLSGLPSGATGVITAMGSRDTTASDRVGEVSINGTLVGTLDAATTAVSNQISSSFSATSEGTLEMRITPAAGSSYAYLNALAVDFD